jgi:hypothetical protein
MAAPTGTHVLLETVAADAHEDQPPSGVGGRQTHGDFDVHQQQELLASVTVAGDASRDDEQLVEGAGLGEYPCSLDEGPRLRLRNIVCALLMNRPVRIRMPGGVGRAG